MKKALSILFFSGLSFYAFGQEKAQKWKPSIEISFTQVPTFIISGTDTSFQNSLSINPSIGIRSKKGFGISYTPAFTFGSIENGLYMHDITIGFEQYNKKQFDYFADFSHFIFTDNNSVPESPITNEFYSVITYKKSWFRPMMSFGMGFGILEAGTEKNFIYDITAAAGISHPFIHEYKKSSAYLTPSLKFNAGTNEYYSFMGGSKYISNSVGFNSYISKKIGKKNESTVTRPALSLRNIELGLRPAYDIGRFNISLATGLFIPVQASQTEMNSIWQLRLNYDF